MRLRTRLAVSGALILGVMGAVGVVLPRAVRASQIGQVDDQLRAAIPVAVGIAQQGGPLATGTATNPLATPLSSLYVARVQGASRVTVLAPAAASGRQPRVPTGGAPGISFATVASVRGTGRWRVALLHRPDGTEPADETVVAVPLDQVDATIRHLDEWLLVAGAAVLAAMAAAGWWLLRLGLGPISEVTHVADAIAAGDRSRRLSGGPEGTEAALLARAFNVMLDEQAAAEDKLRRFVADASHELRTPVAAIGGFADLWRQGGIDDNQLGDVMRRIGQESTRMRGLVEDLLLLAHLDEGRALHYSRFDLRDLLEDAALDASATHPSREVIVDAPVSVHIDGDEARLRQVIGNLVSNALIHTDQNCKVTLRARHERDAATITVSDTGPGMTSEDAASVFDRFWRADPSRARGGAGLGMAIVRGIVEAHRGSVKLRSVPGAGTTVEVTIPSVESGGSRPSLPRNPSSSRPDQDGGDRIEKARIGSQRPPT
jgi:two-component system OmpR family sensor kinase